MSHRETGNQDICVSVIIPVYNVENYLKACLQSVQKQNIEEIEIICVEDCSTDGSLEVLKHVHRKINALSF